MGLSCAVAIAAVLGLASPPALPSVDLSVQPHDMVPTLVSSRTSEDWWAIGPGPYRYDDSARPGRAVRVLRSSDAGRSWQPAPEREAALDKALGGEGRNFEPLDFLTWYSPEVGVAAGYIGARVLRTVDAGRSWQSVPLPDELWVYTLERVGSRTWMCGSSGRLFRSDDAGASWSELKASPFDGEDRCMSLSFLTPESGWAVGMRGTLWSTEDGGVSWTALVPPKQAPGLILEGRDVRPPQLSHVLRLTPQLAWVRGTEGLFQTRDGAKTWQSHPEAETEAARFVSTRADGRPVLTHSAPGLPLAQWIPSLEKGWAMGPDTVAGPALAGLELDVAGQRVRSGPLLTRSQAQPTPLEGVAQRDDKHWLGWAGDQVAETQDGGRTWFRVGRLPRTPVRNLVFLRDGSTFAELAGGYLLRSSNSGRDWTPSTDALAVYDFTVEAGHPPGGKPESGMAPPRWATPFDCALELPGASVKVDFDTHGCFGGSENSLVLELTPDGAALNGERDTLEGPLKVKRQLTRTEGEALMRELIRATTRPESGSGCFSDTEYTVVLEWSCRRGVPKQRRIELTSNGCDPRVFADIAGSGSRPDGTPDFDWYDRVFGIHEVAGRALEQPAP